MAVADAYETVLDQMLTGLRAYFEDVGLEVKVGYGRRELGHQINHGPAGRVVFYLVGGSYMGPRKGGSKDADTVMRNAYTLLADVEFDLWAIDNSDPTNELLQEGAWVRLHEYTLAGIRKVAQGRVVLGKLGPSKGPVEIREGVAHSLSIKVEIPVHYPPDDFAKVKADAMVTIQHSNPQGATADGTPIPPVVHDVATFEVESP